MSFESCSGSLQKSLTGQTFGKSQSVWKGSVQSANSLARMQLTETGLEQRCHTGRSSIFAGNVSDAFEHLQSSSLVRFDFGRSNVLP